MIKQDLDLKISDIQHLANAEAIVALFTSLGYNTSARLKQTPEAMGLDALSREIKRIERLADQEQGTLQVYLIELKRVTVANTRKLAQAFKSRYGIFLLVLTADYERLDFVLINPAELMKKQTEQTTEIGPKTNRLRTEIGLTISRLRTLTIQRLNPDIVALRVLRRFTFTEADVEYQLDKLCSAYNIADWAEPFFNNRALFSDYYLNERLKDSPEWSENPLPALRSFEQLLLNARAQWKDKPVSTTCSALILPALQQLGFRVQPSNAKAARTDTPDYLLFDPQHPEQPLACCNAYAWDRNLDGLVDDARDPQHANENPGARVISVLENEANPEWAMVTNGKFWRLYTRRAHSRAANYYEIDLEEALASPDPGLAFRYFWLFFRTAAFSLTPYPSPASGRGESFLAWLLAECNQYARQLETRLKECVFEEIFPYFAEGFIARQGGAPALLSLPESERQQILSDTFHGTLTFLYRLLFLFYAEARNLLPASEVRDYYEISLARLKQEIADKAGTISDEVQNKLKQAYRPDSYELYEQLCHLFGVIDLGKSSVNVPTYNGGLFISNPHPTDDTPDAANARFLAAHKIPDRFLALGLDRMARDIDARRGDLVMIDYKSLGVQQLGSIYEGLLEFKLRLATEEMAVVRGKKTEQVIPHEQAQKEKRAILRKGRGKHAAEWVLPRGAIYLENDRAERKATGSYYTPDYIVKYIVRNTVGPVLDEKFDGLRPRLRQAQKAYFEAVERQKSFQKIRQAGDDPHKVFNSPENQALVDDFFELRVLDPAMGSGHFLVEAVDYITDRMLAFLNAFPHNPITHALGRTRQTILEEMQHQEINLDPTRLTDVNLLKRHVLKRCIYGVDLNRMAVELAKVSLWLHCFTLGAPLSFLDHHLKQGNSLIGARIEEVRAALEMADQKDRLEVPLLAGLMGSQFAGVMLAADLMRQIGELPDTTAEQVRRSHSEYIKAADALAPYRRILDVYTSRWFGNPDGKLNQPVLQFLRDEQHADWLNDPEAAQARLNAANQQLAATALQVAKDKSFFHWELEFPEVFFGPTPASRQQIVLKENPGFDAVIGNPPYIRAETADKEQRAYLIQSGIYKTIWGRFDVFMLFIERGCDHLAKYNGYFSMIVPGATLTINYAEKLRKQILSSYTLHSVLDLRSTQVFDGVAVATCVIVIQKTPPVLESLVSMKMPNNGTDITQVRNVQQKLFLTLPGSSIRPNIELSEMELKTIVDTESILMGEICYCITGLVGHDSKTGDSVDRLIHNSPIDETCKPYIEAKEWDGRYSTLQPERFIEYKPELMHRPKFPELFESPKILIQRLATGHLIQATLDPNKIYVNHVINCCPKLEAVVHLGPRLNIDTTNLHPDPNYDLGYVLSLVCSRLLGLYHNRYLSPGLDIFPETIRQLPIRRVAFNTSIIRREALIKQAMMSVMSGDDLALLAFVAARLNAQPEESDVVHDLLAYLAGQMLDLNKHRQAEMKRFLSWLEGALTPGPSPSKGEGGVLDALTGKARLRNYLGDYQKQQPELSYAELEDILERNKNKLGVSLHDERFTARLRQEYEASLVVLRPLKERLAWTDWLIDQIVYKLYGLSEEEIQVITASQDQPPAPRPQPVESAAGRIVLANTADAALFLDVLQELSQGKRSPVELASRLSARNPLKNIPTSLVEELGRELRSLGWMEQTTSGLSLNTSVVPTVLFDLSATTQQLHLELALAHERKTQAVSKLLNRLLALAPQRQGALVIPEPEVKAPADVHQLPEFVQHLVDELVRKLGQDYPATRELLNANRLAQDTLAKLTEVWNTLPPSKRNSRLTEVVRDGFAQALFDPLATPRELIFTWSQRLAQAGLWMWARRLYGTAGLTLFPVGAFRAADDSFQPIPAAPGPAALQAYTLYNPQNASFLQKFIDILFEEVQTLSRREQRQREYVSLLAARDRVCYRLRIGNPVFERRLAEAVSLSAGRQTTYSISIEPDRTWQEQSSREMELPVIVNGPRYIISMKERSAK